MAKYVISLLALTIIFLSRCADKPGKEEADCVKPDSINPNGSSELSVLMRNMHDRAAEMKQLIEQGRKLGTFPVEFNKLGTAAPTDSATKKPSFDAFAANYLDALQSVYHSEEGTVAAKYNELVNSCLDCHSDHCPGPVPKIKKLMLN